MSARLSRSRIASLLLLLAMATSASRVAGQNLAITTVMSPSLGTFLDTPEGIALDRSGNLCIAVTRSPDAAGAYYAYDSSVKVTAVASPGAPRGLLCS